MKGITIGKQWTEMGTFDEDGNLVWKLTAIKSKNVIVGNEPS